MSSLQNNRWLHIRSKSRTLSSRNLHFDSSACSLVCNWATSSSALDIRSSACDTHSVQSLISFLRFSIAFVIPSNLDENSVLTELMAASTALVPSSVIPRQIVQCSNSNISTSTLNWTTVLVPIYRQGRDSSFYSKTPLYSWWTLSEALPPPPTHTFIWLFSQDRK